MAVTTTPSTMPLDSTCPKPSANVESCTVPSTVPSVDQNWVCPFSRAKNTMRLPTVPREYSRADDPVANSWSRVEALEACSITQSSPPTPPSWSVSKKTLDPIPANSRAVPQVPEHVSQYVTSPLERRRTSWPEASSDAVKYR